MSTKNLVKDYLSPQPSSREKHDHTTQIPSAGEGVDRGKLKKMCPKKLQRRSLVT